MANCQLLWHPAPGPTAMNTSLPPVITITLKALTPHPLSDSSFLSQAFWQPTWILRMICQMVKYLERRVKTPWTVVVKPLSIPPSYANPPAMQPLSCATPKLCNPLSDITLQLCHTQATQFPKLCKPPCYETPVMQPLCYAKPLFNTQICKPSSVQPPAM